MKLIFSCNNHKCFMSNLYYSALIPFFYLKHLLSVTLDMDADFVKFLLVFNNYDPDANWYYFKKHVIE